MRVASGLPPPRDDQCSRNVGNQMYCIDRPHTLIQTQATTTPPNVAITISRFSGYVIRLRSNVPHHPRAPLLRASVCVRLLAAACVLERPMTTDSSRPGEPCDDSWSTEALDP